VSTNHVTKVAVFIFILAVGFILRTMYDAGEFKTLEPHYSGDCFSVDGVVGAEDITFLKNGTALISSDNRRSRMNGSLAQGTIYQYRPKAKDQKLVNLRPKLDTGFHPHGISVYEHPDGKIFLAVVNHHSGGLFNSSEGHSIELFRYEVDSLFHIRSVSGPLMISPNDIVLINKDQFYVTNDHGSSSGLMQTLEEYLQLRRCNALFYDGKKFSVAASGLGFANGININRDGSLLYVAETIGKQLSIFSRDKNTNDLELIESIDFNSGVDNIEIDSDGNLWIGSHPKMYTFSRHMNDSTVLSPSQVYKVSLDQSNSYTIEEIYLNLGAELSGSTVAAFYDSTLLIGSVFESYFLDCNY
jgi:arylesterase/paraoxonase